MLGFGVVYITYTASSLTGCSVTSSSAYTSDNATHTFTFTPSRKVFANSDLLVNMPAWNSNSNSLGSSILSCAGNSVLSD